MTKTSKAAAFLENMKQEPAEIIPPSINEKTGRDGSKSAAGTRKGLKHIGGYFNRDMVEKVAILRARLGLDNSELIELAINELHSKHKAHRAFSEN
jgi:hypothetical protein